MQPYLRPPWTDSHQIWAVDVHHAPPIHGIQNAEMQKKFFVSSSLLYSIDALPLHRVNAACTFIVKALWHCRFGLVCAPNWFSSSSSIKSKNQWHIPLWPWSLDLTENPPFLDSLSWAVTALTLITGKLIGLRPIFGLAPSTWDFALHHWADALWTLYMYT